MKKDIKKLNALVEGIRETLSPVPVCDSSFKCPGWVKNVGKSMCSMNDVKRYKWKFCPWCGKKIYKKNTEPAASVDLA